MMPKNFVTYPSEWLIRNCIYLSVTPLYKQGDDD